MADLGSRANVNTAINTLLNDLQPNGAILPSLHNGLLVDILDTLSNGLETVLRTGNTTNGQNLTITSSSLFTFSNGSNGRLQSETLTAFRNWTFPNKNGTIAMITDIPVSSNISNSNLSFNNSYFADLNSNNWIVKNGSTNLLQINSNGTIVLKNKLLFSSLSAGSGDWANNVGFSHSSLSSTFDNDYSFLINSLGSMSINCPTGQRINFDQNNSVVFSITPQGKFVYGSESVIGIEDFSVQGNFLSKGSDNSANTTGFKVINSDSTSIVDVRNNGQTAWGGVKVVNVAHAFYNPSSASVSLARFYENNGNIGINLGTSGSIQTYQSGSTVFNTYSQSGVPHIQLFHPSYQVVELQSGASYINTTALTIGSSTGVIGAKFSIQNASANVSQQLFFANVRTNTAGRLGSSGSFGNDQKGLEGFDTDKNKKFFWNGSAWEKIKGNIESVSVATSTSITSNLDTTELEIITALSSTLAINVPTGTNLYNGQNLTFRIKDNGTAQTINWNAVFVDFTGLKPITTVPNKTVYIGCKYNSTGNYWDIVAVQKEP